MSARPIIYWLACSILAAITAHAADPAGGSTAAFSFPEGGNIVLPVPEPGRALLLFAGMMAMAFTYRKVWLNWKRGV